LANFERAIAAKPEFAEAQFAAYARERDAGASGSLRRIETRRTPRMYKEREPLPEIL